MKKPILKFLLLNKSAILPQYAHDDDAGFDLFTTEKVILKPREFKLIPLGIAAEIPVGYFISLRDKSGLAAKYGLHVLGGVIDSGYRGEWLTNIINLGKANYTFQKGEKIVQGVLQPAPQAKITLAKKLSKTARGKGGYGSTGKT